MTTVVRVFLVGCAVLLGLGVLRVATADSSDPLEPAERVIVVGVPGLVWSDVDEERTPTLHRLAERGAIGSLSMRAASAYSCPRDAWVTLGAGNRALYSDPAGEQCRFQYSHSGRLDLELPRIANRQRSYGAVPGLLGETVSCTTVVGREAVLAVFGGTVERVDPPTDSSGWTDAFAGCPLTLVAQPRLLGDEDRRTDQLAELDDRLRPLLTAVDADPSALLLLVSSGDTTSIDSRLGVVMTVRGEATSALVTSSSTNRVPYSQLIDVAPTVLDVLGREQPSDMVGRPFATAADDASLGSQLEQLREAQKAAFVGDNAARPLLWAWVVLVTAACLLALARLRPDRPRPLRDVRTAAIAVVAFPLASLLTNLVPWWTFPWPGAVMIVLMLLLTVLLTVLALRGPWGRSRFGPSIALAVVGFVMLGLEVVLGSPMQLNNFLGYSPVPAGRFSGFGNMPFAMFATFGLLLVAAVSHRLPVRTSRLVILVGGVTVVFLVGAPGLGQDFGGVLATVPALLLLGMIATGVRPSLLKVIGSLAAGAVVVLVVAVADYQRPTAQQTHVGRFVGQVLDGTAATVLQRKAEANLHILLHSPVAIFLPVLLGVSIWLLTHPRGRALVTGHAPTVKALVVGVGVLCAVGSVINDSGVAVLGASLAGAVPLALAVLAVQPDPGTPASETP